MIYTIPGVMIPIILLLMGCSFGIGWTTGMLCFKQQIDKKLSTVLNGTVIEIDLGFKRYRVRLMEDKINE